MNAYGYDLLVSASDAAAVELHVLARAYREAWRVLYCQEPAGIHRLDLLGIAIKFDGPGQPG